MAETTLQIAGRHYDIGCRDGDEPHLARLASLIEDKARLAQRSTPGLTEVRTLLFAALFLADELTDLRKVEAGRQEKLSLEADDEQAARTVEQLESRIEKLREALAAAAAAA
jgi:cell division protein ZapA